MGRQSTLALLERLKLARWRARVASKPYLAQACLRLGTALKICIWASCTVSLLCLVLYACVYIHSDGKLALKSDAIGAVELPFMFAAKNNPIAPLCNLVYLANIVSWSVTILVAFAASLFTAMAFSRYSLAQLMIFVLIVNGLASISVICPGRWKALPLLTIVLAVGLAHCHLALQLSHPVVPHKRKSQSAVCANRQAV